MATSLTTGLDHIQKSYNTKVSASLRNNHYSCNTYILLVTDGQRYRVVYTLYC